MRKVELRKKQQGEVKSFFSNYDSDLPLYQSLDCDNKNNNNKNNNNSNNDKNNNNDNSNMESFILDYSVARKRREKKGGKEEGEREKKQGFCEPLRSE